jgi:hypothetical protein
VPQQWHLPVMICLIPNIAAPVLVEVVIRRQPDARYKS